MDMVLGDEEDGERLRDPCRVYPLRPVENKIGIEAKMTSAWRRPWLLNTGPKIFARMLRFRVDPRDFHRLHELSRRRGIKRSVPLEMGGCP